ncbi:hypothetical protein J2751_002348 [Halorubrum alkaliphilum]|uniref:DUF4013 domain-containing protein n=1 Tax=Halorubrum alkaliphilum TaxID=261290 RepID=A0A8T4GHT9_9EURY|nr:DUF4013 domain-containing protein [Halorubrum alkaliphilum]MBP1923309.1 hypothetical protein [Halorubrum alkaliphilum]
MLRGALATPTRSADAAGTLVVGAVLTFLAWVVTPVWLVAVVLTPPVALAAPIALAPALVARGYYLRVVFGEIGSKRVDGAPPFVRWGGLYRDGIRSALLTVGYLLPLALVLGAVALAGVLVESGRVEPTPVTDPVLGGGSADPGVAVPVLGALGGLIVLLTVAYLLVFTYVRPAALATFAATGRLRDAFRPTLVVPVARSGEYVVGWSLAAVVLLTGYTFAIPLVPLFVGIGLVFATRIVAHALYGRGAADVLNGHPSTLADSPDVTGMEGEARGAADEGVRSAFPRRGARDGPVLAEVPVDVQTGRSVPLGRSTAGSSEGGSDDRVPVRGDVFLPADPQEADESPVFSDDTGDRTDVDPDDDTDRDPGADEGRDSGADEGRDSGADGGRDADRDHDDDGGFDWGPRTDG